MKVTITKLRQDLFKLADQALRGETVEFTYKGVLFRMIPETKPPRLSNLLANKVVAPRADLDQSGRELLQEMEAEWEKDWSEL